ncbi:MAG: thiol:disulfide interchange protein DsbA/DsbL [Steroidobacteraceae bacterium]
MRRKTGAIVAALVLSGAFSAAESEFVEGRHYERLTPAVPVSTPAGVAEVVEGFSYGCPACFMAVPMTEGLKARLPEKTQLVYVPASFIPSEAWPMFQRAYVTAQVMGIADKTHEAMFEAIWKTGELPLIDQATRRVRQPLPGIEETAKSFAVETKVGQAEQLVRAYQADSTPTFIVNGKWKVLAGTGASYEQMTQLILLLLKK